MTSPLTEEEQSELGWALIEECLAPGRPTQRTLELRAVLAEEVVRLVGHVKIPVARVARMLDCSEATVRRLVEDGRAARRQGSSG